MYMYTDSGRRQQQNPCQQCGARCAAGAQNARCLRLVAGSLYLHVPRFYLFTCTYVFIYIHMYIDTCCRSTRGALFHRQTCVMQHLCSIICWVIIICWTESSSWGPPLFTAKQISSSTHDLWYLWCPPSLSPPKKRMCLRVCKCVHVSVLCMSKWWGDLYAHVVCMHM